MAADKKIVSKYEILGLAFIGTIMAQTGCDKEAAMSRVAELCVLTEEQLGVKAELG